MPVYKEIATGIREKHTAERLQVMLLLANENVAEMKPEVYFQVQIETTEEQPLGQPYLDSSPLILNPAEDEELREAIELIQLKIGLARHAQLHAPPEESPFQSPVQG